MNMSSLEYGPGSQISVRGMSRYREYSPTVKSISNAEYVGEGRVECIEYVPALRVMSSGDYV